MCLSYVHLSRVCLGVQLEQLYADIGLNPAVFGQVKAVRFQMKRKNKLNANAIT